MKALLDESPVRQPATTTSGVVQLRRGADAAGRARPTSSTGRPKPSPIPDYAFNLGYAYWFERDPQAAIVLAEGGGAPQPGRRRRALRARRRAAGDGRAGGRRSARRNWRGSCPRSTRNGSGVPATARPGAEGARAAARGAGSPRGCRSSIPRSDPASARTRSRSRRFTSSAAAGCSSSSRTARRLDELNRALYPRPTRRTCTCCSAASTCAPAGCAEAIERAQDLALEPGNRRGARRAWRGLPAGEGPGCWQRPRPTRRSRSTRSLRDAKALRSTGSRQSGTPGDRCVRRVLVSRVRPYPRASRPAYNRARQVPHVPARPARRRDASGARRCRSSLVVRLPRCCPGPSRRSRRARSSTPRSSTRSSTRCRPSSWSRRWTGPTATARRSSSSRCARRAASSIPRDVIVTRMLAAKTPGRGVRRAVRAAARPRPAS